MKSKMVSVFICAVMVANIFAPMAQNAGQANSSAYGSGGLADSPWPMFRGNLNHTGVSPHNTSSNPGRLKWSFTTGGPVESSPAIDSDGTIYVGSIDDKLYAIGTPTQNQPPVADKGCDQTAYEGELVYLCGKIAYDCIFQVPSDVIIIASTYSTGAGGLSYLIRNGGILITGGGSNNYFVESGGSVKSTGGSCNVYLKSGASFNAPGSGSHKIWYESGANIINPGASPTLYLCKKIKFVGYDSTSASIP